MTEDIKKVISNLEKNLMKAYYVENKEQVVPLISSLVSGKESVSAGGSVTLNECGVIDYLRNGKFNFLDRFKQGLSHQEKEKLFREAFLADLYITSSNAITLDGQLYNVDGNSNRIAAIAYGPEKVIVVAGINKIVKDMDEAVLRVKNIAAPKNCVRLNMNTPCAKLGHCIKNDTSYEGCNSPDKICCSRLVCGQQRYKDRISVIIVGEELGY
ncbi:MAG: lactate utilization protein [Clostridia bacterium]|nr:lactate utilization protein [Clostridia bacterium]